MKNPWDEEVLDIPDIKLDNYAVAKLLKHNEVLRDNLPSVMFIKDCMVTNAMEEAKEAWFEIEEIERDALWVATSKGGIFTTNERGIITDGFKGEE